MRLFKSTNIFCQDDINANGRVTTFLLSEDVKVNNMKRLYFPNYIVFFTERVIYSFYYIFCNIEFVFKQH